jgi:hypothetical protein
VPARKGFRNAAQVAATGNKNRNAGCGYTAENAEFAATGEQKNRGTAEVAATGEQKNRGTAEVAATGEQKNRGTAAAALPRR